MKSKVIVFILAVSVLISSICFAETQVTGVATAFDPDSGRLVLQTQSGAKTTVSIPQTVKVYLTINTEVLEIADADAWRFLEANLGYGTKARLEILGGNVTSIWILEVPR